jgi:acyl carrier protein
MDLQVRTKVIDFIVANYLFGDASRMPGDDESLIESGVVDSTGILELIEFLESTFSISVEDKETVPENLGSVSNLVRFVSGKLVVA